MNLCPTCYRAIGQTPHCPTCRAYNASVKKPDAAFSRRVKRNTRKLLGLE